MLALGLVEIFAAGCDRHPFRVVLRFQEPRRAFPEVSAYHRGHQPPCLVLWGRHDPFFELDEVMTYNRKLRTVETHVFNGGHFLLETHGQECAALIRDFIENIEARRRESA